VASGQQNQIGIAGHCFSVILREEGSVSALTTIGLASSFDSPLVPAAMSAGVLATDH
jgi:hypothetical protein